MAVEFLPQSSLFIGIIPALALVYLLISKWMGKYTEKIVFLMFVFGIIFGFLVTFVELYINLINLIQFIIIFRLIEIMGKTVILNLRRFQEKQQTVLYGIVLGLGFGSIYPPVSLLLINTIAVSSLELVSVLIGSLGMLFIQGATGALLGYGVLKRKLFFTVMLSALLNIIFQVLFFYLLIGLVINLTWILIIGGSIVYFIILKQIVNPVSIQSKRRRRMKKEESENK